MLMLVGLMGLMAVGGMAFMGEAFDEEADTGDDVDEQGGETGSHVPSDGPNLILSGDDLANDIDGGPGDDQINGYAGDDVIGGGDGDDVLHGGSGDDDVAGEGGDDTLHGEDGEDTLAGDAGNDLIFGHNNADTLTGGAGDDELHGGLGDDTLSGGDGEDALHGGEGNDRLVGGEGKDTLFGGWGDDWVSGLEPDASGAASDFLNGGGGDDTIIAGQGDIVTAGDGEDTIVLGDWIVGGEAAKLMDFDSDEDQLLMVCDLTENADPVIEISDDPQDADITHIFMDGTEIATVRSNGVLSADDIMLVDYADAPALGLGV